MRILPLALVVGVSAFAHGVLAQEKPTPKPLYTSEAMLKRIQDAAAGDPTSDRRPPPFRMRVTCALPDSTEHVLTATVTVEGRVYRCVQIFDQTFEPAGTAWTPGAKPAYTSEAMLRRIAGGSAATGGGADGMACVLPDKPGYVVNAAVTVDGRRYQCVEMLDQNFERRGAGWTPFSPQP